MLRYCGEGSGAGPPFIIPRLIPIPIPGPIPPPPAPIIGQPLSPIISRQSCIISVRHSPIGRSDFKHSAIF
jgi:hypothetical protein